MPKSPVIIAPQRARQLWISAQRLDSASPFGAGSAATAAAIAHLGYVQIDTINVIERCHHHILWSRIPHYRRADLGQAQSADKTVFEYWTHALSYVASADLSHFVAAMKQHRLSPSRWFGTVAPDEVKSMLKRLRDEGPLSIRDIGDDALVDKTHLWGSRKPSKRILEMMFYQGLVGISARQGMVKTYDLMERHMGAVRELIESRVRRKQLVPVTLAGAEKAEHWAAPETLDTAPAAEPALVHILSPFDPLIIQRKRLKLFFDYEHLFEAYVPAAKRKLGYFALPVLVGDQIVAAVDLKTDRKAGRLLIQQRTDFGDVGAEGEAAIVEALGRFERFQLGA